MPIDLEEIRKGRRREWDALKDPEVRREEERARREADPDYQKRKTAWQKRHDRVTYRRGVEEERWRKVKRETALIGGGALALLLLLFAVNAILDYRAQGRQERKIAAIRAQIDAGEPFIGFRDPMEAWASWRSAWLRRDARALYRTYSPRRSGSTDRNHSETHAIERLQGQIDSGDMDTQVLLAKAFHDPEIVRIPRGRPMGGELAVFLSEPVKLNEAMGQPQRYVLALVFEEDFNEWRVEDIRDRDVWNDRWRYYTQISTSRVRTQYSDPAQD